MTEKRQIRGCCKGFCIDVRQAEKGIVIRIWAEDAEQADALRGMVECCCVSDREPTEGAEGAGAAARRGSADSAGGGDCCR